MNNIFYVYVYYRLDTNEIFYVGKGHGNRWRWLYDRNQHFNNIINKIPVAVEIVKNNLTENEAFYWEEEIIEILVFEYGYSIDIPNNRSNEKGMHLVNMTWGGEGTCGYIPSEETRRKLSEATKGENNPMYGKDWREGKSEEELKEHNRKISEARKGKNPPMTGKKHTKEARKKISESNKKRYTKEKRRQLSKKIVVKTTLTQKVLSALPL